MSYLNTFIKVSEDCPVSTSEIPVEKKGKKPAHLIEYELLMEHPYTLGHEELIYEVFVRRKEISKETLRTEKEKIKKELFSKGHPCLRASALIKRYGFGAHYNDKGKIALFPMESGKYKAFLHDESVNVLPGMRSSR